jgi:monoamine oxidase
MRKTMKRKTAAAGMALALAAGLFGFGQEAQAKNILLCNVVVVGGGAAGVHTAYQLARLPKSDPDSRVCVFEKEDRLGGRIHDVALDPQRPELVYGMGALRVMETQDYLFQLADELGITLEAAGFEDDMINARGVSAFSSDDLSVETYPLVKKEFIAGSGFDTEYALYDELRLGPNRANIGQYPDLRSYMRATLGTQGYQFLADIFRFRGDFTVDLSAAAYMEYLDEEWDVCCTPYYPEGGMSQFVKRMANKAKQNGAKFYLKQSVSTISRMAGGLYSIKTKDYSVVTRKVVIAVPKEGLEHIGGNIAERIKAQPQFQDLRGIKVVTIAQRWPYAWWEGAVPGKNTHRAWTTEHCLNAIEIPTASYAAQQLVTRSVYDDSLDCTEFWERTAQLGTGYVEKEIAVGLQMLFPEATIPQPLNTVVQVWPAAWYWLKGGSIYSNADIAAWAAQPLVGENIALASESYNPQRSGWSDGAYKSSINALNMLFDANLTAEPVSMRLNLLRAMPVAGRRQGLPR